jgi:hypothetical protein
MLREPVHELRELPLSLEVVDIDLLPDAPRLLLESGPCNRSLFGSTEAVWSVEPLAVMPRG